MQDQITMNQEDDEFVYRLDVNGKAVCGARTESYRILLSIKTADGEEGKGYAKKLLTHIETIAKENSVRIMETSDIDPCDYKAICFFKSMNYTLSPIKKDQENFLEGKKDLWGKEILRLVQKVDKNFKRISIGMFFHSSFFIFFLAILFMLIPMEIYLFSIRDIGIQLSIVIPFSALLIAFTKPFYDSIFETRILRNVAAISKNEERMNQLLIKVLVRMKAKSETTDLELSYNMNPSLFTKEKLVERLYG